MKERKITQVFQSWHFFLPLIWVLWESALLGLSHQDSNPTKSENVSESPANENQKLTSVLERWTQNELNCVPQTLETWLKCEQNARVHSSGLQSVPDAASLYGNYMVSVLIIYNFKTLLICQESGLIWKKSTIRFGLLQTDLVFRGLVLQARIPISLKVPYFWGSVLRISSAQAYAI